MELKVDSVFKTYGDRQVLNDIILGCQKGEVIGLVGRNGQGKSTLLKIISGNLSSQNRYIKVDNKVLNSNSGLHKFINYLPQGDFFPQHLRVNEAIGLICDEKSKHILFESEHVRKHIRSKINQLSGGELRMIEILAFLHSRAPFLLMDEVFDSLSPVFVEEVKNEIKKAAKYKGIIVTDQDYRAIMEISSKTVLLNNGSLTVIKNVEQLREKGYLPA